MIHTLFSPGLKGSFFSAIAFSMLLVSCDQCNKPPVDDGDGPITASFTHNLQPNCPVPCQVCFANNSQHADSYSWDFGNGQTSTETAPCVTYTTRGTYTVTLTAIAGTQSTTTSQTLTIQDNAERYKLTIPANTYGSVKRLLQYGQNTFALLNVDSYLKIRRFNSTGFTEMNFQGAFDVNDMVLDLDGSILCAGTASANFPTKIGLAKLSSSVPMSLTFERTYDLGYSATGYSVVPKNTNSAAGYIVASQLQNGTNNQGGLVNTFDNGDLYFADPIEYSNTVKKIFRNAGSGSNSYVAIGEWFDPSNQKIDMHISTVNENGVDFLPINMYPGIDNAYNDLVNDAAQSVNGTSYAVVGFLGNKPTFLSFNYQAQSFSQPIIKQDFPANITDLRAVCPLANNQGFAVCGYAKTGSGLLDIAIFVAKLDNSGNIVWQKTIGNNTYVGDIVAAPDGGFFVGGQEYCADLSCSHPVLYKLDSNGEYQ